MSPSVVSKIAWGNSMACDRVCRPVKPNQRWFQASINIEQSSPVPFLKFSSLSVSMENARHRVGSLEVRGLHLLNKMAHLLFSPDVEAHEPGTG